MWSVVVERRFLKVLLARMPPLQRPEAFEVTDSCKMCKASRRFYRKKSLNSLSFNTFQYRQYLSIPYSHSIPAQRCCGVPLIPVRLYYKSVSAGCSGDSAVNDMPFFFDPFGEPSAQVFPVVGPFTTDAWEIVSTWRSFIPFCTVLAFSWACLRLLCIA